MNLLVGKAKRPDTFSSTWFLNRTTVQRLKISRYEQNVISLDNIFNKEFGKSRVERFLGYCAATLGFLQVNGGVHGDANKKHSDRWRRRSIIDLTYFQRFESNYSRVKYKIQY